MPDKYQLTPPGKCEGWEKLFEEKLNNERGRQRDKQYERCEKGLSNGG